MDDVRMDMGTLAAAVGRRLPRIIFVSALLLGLTYAGLRFVPKTYESTAAVLFESRDTAFTRAADDAVQTSTSIVSDATAVASQVELIKSRGTLLDVIESENLRDVDEFNGSRASLVGTIKRMLGRPPTAQNTIETVLGNVAARLTVFRARESHVISIKFRSKDPTLSARVANAIADTHVRRRADLSIQDTSQASQWLLVEIEKLRTRVAEAESKVAAYRVDNDLFVGDNNTNILDQQLSDIAAQITSAQERKNTAKSRAALIAGLLDAGQPIDGVSDVRSSVVVQRLSEEKARLQGDRAQRLATLLPDHPVVRSLSAQIAEIDKQILTEGRQVADALQAEARIEAGVEQSLRDELTRLKINVSSASQDTVALNELQREAKAQRDLLETFLLRYRDAAARSDSSLVLPDVRVISEAAAAISPASPKSSLILAAVAMISLVLQLGHILFSELLSGRALMHVPQNRPSRHPTEFEQEYEGHGNTDQLVEPGAEPLYAEPSETAYTQEVEAWGADILESEVDEPQHEEGQSAAAMAIEHSLSRANEAAAKIVNPAASKRTTGRQSMTDAMELSEIGERLATGHENLVLIVTLSSWRESHATVEALTAELVQRQLSVVEVDAGSRRPGSDLGLADLAAGDADFGDVVHRGRRTDFAIVPWGQIAEVDFKSPRCATLIDALTDIFEIVIIDTGRAGMASSLPAFAYLDALVLLAVPEDTTAEAIEEVRRDLADINIANLQVIAIDAGRTKVA